MPKLVSSYAKDITAYVKEWNLVSHVKYLRLEHYFLSMLNPLLARITID